MAGLGAGRGYVVGVSRARGAQVEDSSLPVTSRTAVFPGPTDPAASLELPAAPTFLQPWLPTPAASPPPGLPCWSPSIRTALRGLCLVPSFHSGIALSVGVPQRPRTPKQPPPAGAPGRGKVLCSTRSSRSRAASGLRAWHWSGRGSTEAGPCPRKSPLGRPHGLWGVSLAAGSLVREGCPGQGQQAQDPGGCVEGTPCVTGDTSSWSVGGGCRGHVPGSSGSALEESHLPTGDSQSGAPSPQCVSTKTLSVDTHRSLQRVLRRTSTEAKFPGSGPPACTDTGLISSSSGFSLPHSGLPVSPCGPSAPRQKPRPPPGALLRPLELDREWRVGHGLPAQPGCSSTPEASAGQQGQHLGRHFTALCALP
uniref:translation initiation factor IF-2-like n=1 Tax=Ictidomys tridecemlineatus TaxID=43179 RepID=UPI001A9FEF31|nr:translation initiation factor IF-2-like [Ictidomys tridecemlineatus]